MRGGRRTAPPAYRPSSWPRAREEHLEGPGEVTLCPSRPATPRILCGIPRGTLPLSIQKCLCLRESEAGTGVLGSPCAVAAERVLAAPSDPLALPWPPGPGCGSWGWRRRDKVPQTCTQRPCFITLTLGICILVLTS